MEMVIVDLEDLDCAEMGAICWILFDTSRDQWIKCFDFGELRMVAEGLQNKYQLRRKVGVNRPNTLRWLS